jgi:hypothetical protein
MISATETKSATENLNPELRLFNGFTLDELSVKYFVQKIQRNLRAFRENERIQSFPKKVVFEVREKVDLTRIEITINATSLKLNH